MLKIRKCKTMTNLIPDFSTLSKKKRLLIFIKISLTTLPDDIICTILLSFHTYYLQHFILTAVLISKRFHSIVDKRLKYQMWETIGLIPLSFPKLTFKIVSFVKCLDLGGDKIITNDLLGIFTNLTSLNLSCNDVITDASLYAHTNLTTLNLYGNDVITNDSVSTLTNLTMLDLSCNSVITNSALHSLTNLTKLNLYGNRKITREGLVTLTKLIR